MRLRYRRRRDRLVTAVGEATPHVRVSGAAAGLNALLPLPNEQVEAEALAAAKAERIGVAGLAADRYYERGEGAGLLVGFAAAPEHAYPSAVEALAGVLARLGRLDG
jgi:GntR family transcriptional regulator/MocR family aminotransferase